MIENRFWYIYLLFNFVDLVRLFSVFYEIFLKLMGFYRGGIFLMVFFKLKLIKENIWEKFFELIN